MSVDTLTAKILLVFTRVFKFVPEAIKQQQQQTVQVDWNIYFPSPYPTHKMTTSLRIGDNNMISYTQSDLPQPIKYKNGVVTYGPYNDIPATSSSQSSIPTTTIMYESKSYFIRITSLEREIMISHYGHISVVDSYQLKNDGTRLIGEFSRFDYERQLHHSNSFRVLQSLIPMSASEISYYDRIGNISTSLIRYHQGQKLIEMLTRYPLYGQWQTDFKLEYKIPVNDFIYFNEQTHTYVFNYTFFSSLLNDCFIDQLTVNVILPEGATNEQLKMTSLNKQDVEMVKDTYFSYFDTLGRTRLSIKKSNAVRQHDQVFEVSYQYSLSALIRKPMLICSFFFAFFMLARQLI